jgi:signal recognition particle subunit SRP54
MQMDDINKLVKQFEQMNKMMKMMQGGKSSKLMQMFGK